MRKITFIILYLFFSISLCDAQSVGLLWGMTSTGGDSGAGVLFTYDAITSQENVIHSFPIPRGTRPYNTELLQASDGNFYGMTSAGGSSNDGTLFRCTPSFSVTTLINFSGGNGATPRGGLIQASDGNLYGMTYNGGTSGSGNIFKYNISSGTLTNLVNFNTTNGAYPYGNLLQASDGNLYGMTYSGGTKGYGTIFKCTTSGTLTNLVNFTSTNGANPLGNLIQATDGNLYGMTYNGGAINAGTIFRCTTSGTLTNLIFFNNTDGARPTGSLIQATDGNLYGMTFEGGTSNTGTTFKINITTGALSSLGSFPSGASPEGSFVQATDGNLYALTSGAGTNGYGTLFRCTTTGTITPLVNFNKTNGSKPYGTLIQATDGNLYGETYAGGTVNSGTLFKCSTSGTFSTEFNFGSTPIGTTTYGNVIQAKDGNIYGMTWTGGLYNKGTIFKCTTQGVLSTLVNFDSVHGANPHGSLIQASDGNFYGMTYAGGAKNEGVIFKCTTSGVLDTLLSFMGTNGANPYGSLLQANDGSLYGMTYDGGTSNYGTVFKCTTSGTLTTFVNFDNSTNGANPFGGLIQASDGNLWGMTFSGGPGTDGVLFKCTTSGTFKSMIAFGTNSIVWWGGDGPYGNVLQASDGGLYGMTVWGGTAGGGNVFKVTLSGAMLYSYSFSTDLGPQGSLIQASDGYLYGMSTGSGVNNGDIIRFGIDTTFKTLYSLESNLKLGAAPWSDFMEAMSTSIIDSVCTGSGSTLNATVRGAKSPYTYLWSTGATTSSIQGVTTGGTYSVTVTDARGIAVSDVFSYLNVTTSIGQVICKGDSAQLSALANGGAGKLTYNWMPGNLNGTSPSVKPMATTTYTVTVIDGAGCTNTATQTVTVTLLPVATITYTNPICVGTADTLFVSGGTSYSWKNTGSTSDTLAVNPTSTATYSLTMSNGICSTDTSVVITVNPIPTVFISGDSIICAGNTTKLTASGAVNYLWEPSGNTSASITISPTSNVTYTVIGTSFGCMNFATRTVSAFPSNGFDLAGNLQICIDTPSFSSASIQACIYNNRCLPVNGRLILVLDTAIHIANTIADSVAHISGDTLTWNYDSLSDIGITHSINLTGTVSNATVGDSVFVSMFISPTVGDSNPANNSVTYWVKAFPYNCVGLPFDPNEKSVSPIGAIADTQKLTYTIHFQNTGTAVAHNVVVIDTLSANLDPTTVKILSASNEMTTQVVSGHIIKFIFNNINLPDTATSKTTSIGVFSFTIKPSTSAVAGDNIINNAGIYFDANPVITTNNTVNTIAGTPLSVKNLPTLLNVASFPNPFTISTSVVFNTDGQHYLGIYDAVGRKIESVQCTGKQYELQRGDLAAGIYFIKAFDAGQKYVATVKLIAL